MLEVAGGLRSIFEVARGMLKATQGRLRLREVARGLARLLERRGDCPIVGGCSRSREATQASRECARWPGRLLNGREGCSMARKVAQGSRKVEEQRIVASYVYLCMVSSCDRKAGIGTHALELTYPLDKACVSCVARMLACCSPIGDGAKLPHILHRAVPSVQLSKRRFGRSF